MNTTSATVALQLTTEQAVTVYAALFKANSICRDHQLQMLNLHECQSAGPVTRAEAWKTFKTWERHENETAELQTALKKAMGADLLPFSAFSRFA